MKQEYRDFGAQFAAAVIAQDYDRAWGHFAPWLQAEVSPDEIEAAIQEEMASVAESLQVELPPAPAGFEVDGNSMTIAALREEAERSKSYMPDQAEISAEITDANFRQWAVIQFQNIEDDDTDLIGWLDFWFSIVEVDGILKVGHFNIEGAD